MNFYSEEIKLSRINKSRIFPILTIALGLLLVGVAIVFGFSTRETPLSMLTTPPQESTDVLRITIVEAKQAFDSGEAIFVDVRDRESFITGHISGAISIPLAELPDRLDELAKSALIIPY